MPLLILVFVALLLIRDYLNETGYTKNLIGRLKTRYRLHRIRQARKKKRAELKRQAEWQELLRDGERVAIMVSRFLGGVADMSHTLTKFYPATNIPTSLDLKEDETPEETALQTLIKRAVEVEDYESAAIYWDKLKKLYLSQEFKKIEK